MSLEYYCSLNSAMTPGTRLPQCKGHSCFTICRARDICQTEAAKSHFDTLQLDAQKICQQDREITKTEGGLSLPSLLWEESKGAMLNCRGPLGNSECKREGLQMNTCNDKYYVKYRRVPSPLDTCTTDAELASCAKWEVGSRP